MLKFKHSFVVSPMIHFQNVSVQYGKHTVLKDITLQISGGEFVALIGPSGAGKSTLLNALIGESPNISGSITIDGYEITEFDAPTLQTYRQKVGVVFQDYKLLEQKTVYENVAFALEVCGWKEEDIRERVYEVLNEVELLDHADKFPSELSGGEIQRTAIARALVHRPKLFIADEPTGNLDYQKAMEIMELLIRIHEKGATILLATHNREVVDRLQKRVIALNEGKIVTDKEQSGYEIDFVEEIEIFAVERH